MMGVSEIVQTTPQWSTAWIRLTVCRPLATQGVSYRVEDSDCQSDEALAFSPGRTDQWTGPPAQSRETLTNKDNTRQNTYYTLEFAQQH